jgi:hypothetical protein
MFNTLMIQLQSGAVPYSQQQRVLDGINSNQQEKPAGLPGVKF